MTFENMLPGIDNLKKELDGLRPLSSGQVKSLKTYFDIELTYNSNAIEGSTLSLSETKIILLDGITIGGKSTREHLEAINHREAIGYIEELARLSSREITRSDVLGIHAIILRGIDSPNAGKYRTVNVYVLQAEGRRHVFPEPLRVPELMDGFFTWLQQPGELHPVALASEAHYRLVSIHPFADGNGRAARLLMNLILMQYGYTPAIVKMTDRAKYIQAIESAQQTGNMEPLYVLMAEALKESLEVYLKTIKENILWK